jgi:hypothetical protein
VTLAFRMAAPVLRELCRGPARRFRAALAEPERAQRLVLHDAVTALAQTEYGRCHGLSADDGVDQFRKKIPVVDYRELAPWVARQRRDGGPVLTREAVEVWATTSGSGGARKDIPYTRALLSSFAGMFRVWADDLLNYGPPFVTGHLAMSVSPRGPADAAGAVGIRDDSDYLPWPLRQLLRPFLVWPPTLARLGDSDAFRDIAAALLLANDRLEIVSVWSPTFFLILLDHLSAHGTRLAAEMRHGRLERQGLRFRTKPLDHRRSLLVGATRPDWRALWPQLKLISCWTAAEAALPARQLGDRFPGVLVQGKGLLATEAPLTLPLLGMPAPVPLVDAVFIEILKADGGCRLLHELADGDEGEAVITTPGGFPRYRLGDRVRVQGRALATPCLTFLHRAGESIDLVGEKLDAGFVSSALAETLSRTTAAATLLPWRDAGKQGYILAVDVGGPDLSSRADAALMASFRYREARALGQLAPLRVIEQRNLGASLQAFFAARGMLAGDIKDRALMTDITQAKALLAWLQAAESSAQASAESGVNRPS